MTLTNENQERVLATWLANPRLTYAEIAEKAGVGDRTFYQYRQDPAFIAEYEARCREWFDNLKSAAIDVVEEAIFDGDVKTAQWLLENVGYKAANKVEVDTPNTVKISITE